MTTYQYEMHLTELAENLVVARDRWVASPEFTNRHFDAREYRDFVAAAEAFAARLHGDTTKHHDELVEEAIAIAAPPSHRRKV